MIIRKKFRFECAHIVRNAVSERCKFSIHGHSYEVEVFLNGCVDDFNGMLMDFIEFKNIGVSEFLDRFDHSIVLWKEDDEDYKKDMMKHSQRVVVMEANPTAENMAIVFHYHIQNILNTQPNKINVKCVRVHETVTGYAESESSDLSNFEKFGIVFK